MADYKRFVSYMYEYENGEKKKNVGFSRVELRKGTCRFTIHMRMEGVLDGIFPTYLIYRPNDEMELIYLGDCIVKNQLIDSRLTAKEDNVVDSGYGFSDMGGMLLFLNSKIFYATQWDDKPVILEEVLQALKQGAGKPISDAKLVQEPPKETTFSKKEVSEEEVISKEAIKEVTGNNLIKEDNTNKEARDKKIASKEEDKDIKPQIPLYKLPRRWKIKEVADPVHYGKPINPWEMVERYNKLEADKVKVADAFMDTKKEEVESVRDIKDIPKENTTGKESLEKDIAAINMQKSNKLEDSNPLLNKIFNNYPRIYPFEDNEVTRCVKIEPKDIGMLPAELWILSNNSFLLHGYYCYHHLIFAELVDSYGCRYFIGVPGIYHNRERFMARMFGFELFKSIRKRELKQGDFGYWYMEINI
ncbi:DUF6128 domain-containing protein [Herbinix luporum]|uniref:DUF6128 domain-containing protein n=1 Tax=Herbinix luporum TaxID=1679721 RepID=UPI0023EFA4A5|nr:DUF6128 domain-containing protein [Herbinix luporum]